MLSITLSNHCQMDCAYCCIREKNKSPILTVEQVMNFVHKYKFTDGRPNMIEFFGGEPTLHMDLISQIIDKASDDIPGIKFRLFTNGLIEQDKLDQYIYVWPKFEEILLSLDGIFEFNKARGNTESEYKTIVNAYKYFNAINHTGLMYVVATPMQYRKHIETIEYFYNELGVRYFSPEICTVWEDKAVVPFSKEKFFYTILGYLYILTRSFSGDPMYLSIGREFVTPELFFADGHKTCNDDTRAISPRGEIYLCRDHAANEEGMMVNKDKIVTLEEALREHDDLKIHNNSFDHIMRLNKLTACPVKSLQFESYAKKSNKDSEDLVWWLKEDPYKTILDLIYSINRINSENIRFNVLDDKKWGKDYSDFIDEYMLKIFKTLTFISGMKEFQDVIGDEYLNKHFGKLYETYGKNKAGNRT